MYKYSLLLTDRNGNDHKTYPMMFRDALKATQLIPKVIDVLMLGGTIFEKFRTAEVITLAEQYEALQELLRYATIEGTNVDTFDIHMAKLAFFNFVQYGRMDEGMKQYKTGDIVIDRDGNEHTAYSYLITDYDKAIELLQKIDTVNMVNNIMDVESKAAMLEIVCLALNNKEQPEDITKYLDAEFARKAIRIYFDLPVMD